MTRNLLLIGLCITLLCSACAGQNVPPPTASPTPGRTPAPTEPPTPRPSPTPAPTSTPAPPALLTLASQALFYGDYERAAQVYQQALNEAGDDPTRAQALLGLGRVQILLGQPSVALTTLSSIRQRFPSSPLLAQAAYFMGAAYRAQDNLPKAVEAYTETIQRNPGILDAYLYEVIGDLLAQSGDAQGALDAYTAAVAAPQLDDPTPIELKAARMLAVTGDLKSAVRRYLKIYDETQNEYYKAQVNYLAGQAYLALGLPEQAYARYQDSVANFIRPIDSYNALVALVNAGIEVDELQRGLIDYYAQQYGYAVEALTRYIEQNPAAGATAHHYKALSLLAMKQTDAALAEWELIIEKFPDDPLWPAAWDEKSYLQWTVLGEYDKAAETLLAFAARAPQAKEAPAYLYEAARILERDDRLEEAAPVWEKVMALYPSSEVGWRALFLAGVSYYRLANYEQAQITFQRALVFAADGEEQSTADYWIAKTYQAQGKPTQATTYWEQATGRDPTAFYSVRAREALLGLPPLSESVPTDLTIDWEQERRLAEGWMRLTFNLPADTDLSGPGDLAQDARYQRGVAFWQLGLYAKARQEFEALRDAVADQPDKTYRLLQPLLEMGLYRSAVFASRQVLTLAGMDNNATLNAPAYFNHIRFGTYFQDLVLAYAGVEKFDPLFLFSVLRQESLFEGFASSGAGARGLMQIMPATGAEIAAQLHWPLDFTSSDLFRPLVSIRLGTRYLARQRDAFQGDLFAALAAYNGGPGNAAAWRDLAGKDPDVFLEVIRIKETRDYIVQIYEFFNLYRILYQKNP